MRRLRQSRRGNSRRGQSLVEFALFLPLLVVIVGATLSFGLFFFQANVLQQAVDVAAQETARMPFSPTTELGLGDLSAANTTVMYDADFQGQIYDEQYLVIHDSEWDNSTPFNGNFRAYMDSLPLLNRLLATVLVRDLTYANGVTRFPGAIVRNTQTNEETVLVPLLTYTADGVETLVDWVAPVEEIRTDHDQNSGTPSVGPFSLIKPTGFASSAAEDAFLPGMVALRINYPAQAATLMNRTGDRGQNIVEAADATLADGTTGNYTLLVSADDDATSEVNLGTHSGRYGLGRQATFLYANGVRPYRKVMSVQAIYRREVFQ